MPRGVKGSGTSRRTVSTARAREREVVDQIHYQVLIVNTTYEEVENNMEVLGMEAAIKEAQKMLRNYVNNEQEASVYVARILELKREYHVHVPEVTDWVVEEV